MHIQAVEPRERVLSVRWSDATTSDFPYLFLSSTQQQGIACCVGFISIAEKSTVASGKLAYDLSGAVR